ncbi:hypothetical protein D3C86_2114810 [compost metagenome]
MLNRFVVVQAFDNAFPVGLCRVFGYGAVHQHIDIAEAHIMLQQHVRDCLSLFFRINCDVFNYI